MALLNLENYGQGFLVDDDLMAGVTQQPENPNIFVAFVLKHGTGEYLGYQPYPELDTALEAINRIERTWTFERFGGCGGGCGEGGGCNKGSCGKGKCGTGS